MLGLDLGSRYIKVVQLGKKGKLTNLIGYGKTEMPENYLIEGIVSEPEKLAAVIKTLINEKVWGKITATRLNASLPESKIFTRIITLPQLEEKELKDAINWEASQSIPMSLSDLYLDWQIIGPSKDSKDHIEVLLAAAPKSIVNSYLQLFKELGMEPFSIETSLNPITRAMIPARDKDETVMVIDLGGQTTNMAIFDQVIRVTGTTPVGGDHITAKIASSLQLTNKEAEKLKLSNLEDKDKKKAAIREAIDEELTEITKEAARIINYYNEKLNKEDSISKIFLCGGNALIPHLTDFVTEKLGIQTEIGNPWSNISVYPIKAVKKSEAPAYTNAIGLALLGVNDD